MRIILRGQASPSTLNQAFQQLADRLQNAGVEKVERVNLYLHASIDGEEVQVINKSGTRTDILETWIPFGEGVESSPRRALPPAAIVRVKDVSYFDTFTKFAASLGLSRELRCELLSISVERLSGLSQDWLEYELPVEKRNRLSLLGRMIEAANELATDWDDAMSWFKGVGRHESRINLTPIEQIEVGGISAVESICAALELLVRRKRLGLKMGLPSSNDCEIVDEPVAPTARPDTRRFIDQMGSPPGVADVEVEFPQSRDMPRAAEFDD